MMKPKSFTHIVISVVLLTISVGCGTNFSPPTVMPTPSNTVVPTATLKPTITYTPTKTPTETPTPIAEKDLQPAYMEAITQTYMEVEINLSIITDESLDSFNPSIHRIYLNPHFNNYKGENSQEALAHFTTLAFYKLWQSGKNTDPSVADVDFESYLQLWSQAQKSNDPADWEKVQIDGIWANDLKDGNGYIQQKYMIWPMYTGDPTQVPQGVRAITEFDVAIGRPNKMKNITLFPQSFLSFGTNLDDNKLYVYEARGSNGNAQYTGG